MNLGRRQVLFSEGIPDKQKQPMPCQYRETTQFENKSANNSEIVFVKLFCGYICYFKCVEFMYRLYVTPRLLS